MIIKTLDVFCDYPDCGEWTHGETGKYVTAKQARANVYGGAQQVGGDESGWTRKGSKDLCPDHNLFHGWWYERQYHELGAVMKDERGNDVWKKVSLEASPPRA